MKGAVCGVCGFISIDGTIPEKCPVCGASKAAFKEIDDALKTSKDVATYGESEKKHIPVINVKRTCGLLGEGCVDVTALIGAIEHPMLPEHFITNIDLYIDKRFVSRVHLTPGTLHPAAGWHLKAASGTVSVIEHCNVHGSWINEVAL